MLAFRPFRLQSPSVSPSSLSHATPQLDGLPAFHAGLGFASGWQARRSRSAESSSLSYGLVIHLLLLSTSSCDDAVTVGYRPESVCLERTFTPLAKHAFRRTTPRKAGGLVSGAASKAVALLV